MKYTKKEIKREIEGYEGVSTPYLEALRHILKQRREIKRLRKALKFLGEKIFTDDNYSAEDALETISVALGRDPARVTIAPAEPEPRPFKVGDKVRVKESGRKGFIIEDWKLHEHDTCPYRVEDKHGNYIDWFSAADLEHINEVTP